MAEPSSPDEPPEAPELPALMMPEGIFAGVWANVVDLQQTPHEFTLDFVRMGPQFQIGEYVARISFSPALFVEMVDMFNEAYTRYIVEQGLPD